MARRPMRQITISCKDNQLFFLAIQRNFPFWKKKKLFLRTRKKGEAQSLPQRIFCLELSRRADSIRQIEPG